MKNNESARRSIIRPSSRSALRLLSALVLVSMSTMPALVVDAVAASASIPLTVTATQRMPGNTGLVGFSSAPPAIHMSRNVRMEILGATPNGNVWYGVHDTTSADVNAWYGGWVQADVTGAVRSLIITGIPQSACGHELLAAASDETTGAASVAVFLTDDCSPMVAAQRARSGATILGDGFSPGGKVHLAAYANGASKPATWSADVFASVQSSNLGGGSFAGGRVVAQQTGRACVRTETIYAKDITTGISDKQVWACI